MHPAEDCEPVAVGLPRGVRQDGDADSPVEALAQAWTEGVGLLPRHTAPGHAGGLPLAAGLVPASFAVRRNNPSGTETETCG